MNLKIEVRGVAQAIDEVKGQYQDFLERVADKIVETAPKFTPKKTGLASRSWESKKSRDNFEVTNTQPYTVYLEKPYTKSRQAPRGIIGPTLDSIKGKIK